MCKGVIIYNKPKNTQNVDETVTTDGGKAKKTKTKKRKGNDWTRLVTETYNKNKHQKNYTFKKAINDAKKVYKKVGKTRRKR